MRALISGHECEVCDEISLARSVPSLVFSLARQSLVNRRISGLIRLLE
jgi:hypothetical protein